MSTQDRSTKTRRRTVGSALIVFGSVLLLASASAKFARAPQVVAQLGAFGFVGWKLTVVACLEVLSALLYLIPRTRAAGLLVVSAFFGGAIATHMQHDQSVLVPAAFLGLLWLGAWLRHPEALWTGGVLAHEAPAAVP